MEGGPAPPTGDASDPTTEGDPWQHFATSTNPSADDTASRIGPISASKQSSVSFRGAADDHAGPRHSVTLQQRSYSRAVMVPASAPPMPRRDGRPPCRALRVRTVSTPAPAARTLIPPTMSRYNKAP